MTDTRTHTPFAIGNALRDHLHDVHRLMAGVVVPTVRDIQENPTRSFDDDRIHGLLVLIVLLSGALLPLVAEALAHVDRDNAASED